jgi:DNA-binding MarR family transcriptional regulator
MAKQTTIPDVIDKFWETIPPAWHATRAHIRGVAAENLHMTTEQFQVLRRIRKGIDSVSALADANRTSRSSVSKAVDVLVNKGLVTRLTDNHDRRHIQLTLTDEGVRLMNAVYTETEQWLAARFERLSPEELTLVLQAMDVLRKVFDESK